MNALRNLDLSKRFIILMVGLIMLTVFSAQWFYSRQSRTYLELRLKEKAAFINKFYSYVIAGLLMRKDDIGLLQVINTLEEDQEISSVIVVDQ